MPSTQHYNTFTATYANLPEDDQRTRDTIMYGDDSGNVGIITENYRFQEIPE